MRCTIVLVTTLLLAGGAFGSGVNIDAKVLQPEGSYEERDGNWLSWQSQSRVVSESAAVRRMQVDSVPDLKNDLVPLETCGLAYPIRNYIGSDIAIVSTATGEECARVCAQIVQCACMSYMTNSTCFLKSPAGIPGGTSTLVEAVISYDVSGCKEPANYTVIDLTQPADQAILLKNFPDFQLYSGAPAGSGTPLAPSPPIIEPVALPPPSSLPTNSSQPPVVPPAVPSSLQSPPTLSTPQQPLPRAPIIPAPSTVNPPPRIAPLLVPGPQTRFPPPSSKSGDNKHVLRAASVVIVSAILTGVLSL